MSTKLYTLKEGSPAEVIDLWLGPDKRIVKIMQGGECVYDNWPVYTPLNSGRHTTISEEPISYGDSYTTTITPDSGSVLMKVTVTMAGKDITSAVYSDGVVTIPKVKGPISISAMAYIPEGLECSDGLLVPSDDDSLQVITMD